MFPLSNNIIKDYPSSYCDQQVYNLPLFNDIIFNFKQEVPPLSFCHLPSPAIPYDQLELEERDIFFPQNFDLLLHQQQQPLRADSTTLSQTTVNMTDSNKKDIIALTEICINDDTTPDQIPIKRSSKRDRHTKINTAQGPRDRRMRLSLKVAREFFDLQDKLGFDKGSKTVEWLLLQARGEIKKLSTSAAGFSHTNCSFSFGTKSASSASEGEVLSEINDPLVRGSISKGKTSVCGKRERKTSRAPRKNSFNPFAKESREKARARARERTKEKLWTRRIDESKLREVPVKNKLNQLGCSSPRETGDQESGIHNIVTPSMDMLQAEVEVPNYHDREQLDTPEGMLDESFVIMDKWSPSFSSHLHNGGISQENQFTDFQSFCKTIWDQSCNITGGIC